MDAGAPRALQSADLGDRRRRARRRDLGGPRRRRDARADRERIRRIAEEKGLSPQWHFVDAPQDVRRARVAGRNAAKGETFVMEVTPEMFERLEAIYEPPAPAELEGAVLSVSDEAGMAAPAAAQSPTNSADHRLRR